MEKKLSWDDRVLFKSAWVASLTALGLLVFVICFLYASSLQSLIEWWWTTSKYAHSLIIFPAIVYLIYIKRHLLFRLSPNPSLIALLFIAPTAIMIPLFLHIGIQLAVETLLVLLFPLVIWLSLGSHVVRVLAIPLALLITVAPIWELFSPVLTQLTADVSHISLRALGVPVFRDEVYLTIPEGVFHIAEGCGGFRYFISGLSLGLIFAYLNFRTLKAQVLVVSLAVCLSVVINWIRVMIVIWAGHVTDMQHPYVQEHVNLGWYVFAAGFFLFFFVCTRFYFDDEPVEASNNEESVSTEELDSKKSIFAILLVALLLVAPIKLLDSVKSPAIGTMSELSMPDLDGWQGPFYGLSRWSPYYAGAHDSLLATYRKGDDVMDVFVARYVEQSQDLEMINFNNRIVNEGWMVLKSKRKSIELQEGSLSVDKIFVKSDEGRASIWKWYQVAGVDTSDQKIAKLLELKKLVSEHETSLVFAVRASDKAHGQAIDSEVEALIGQIHPKLQAFENTY